MRQVLPAVVLALGLTQAAAANPSMSDDFARMMGWLSNELAQGLAFNAGETFDPPRELTSRRLQPDLSLGVGRMPLSKSKFPEPRTQALKDMNASGIFPSSVLFPNLSMHLRAGLPGRMDLSVRFDDMTTPSNYRLSGQTRGRGQSNSVGCGVRRHFFGGADRPTLSVGGNFNHVFGRFSFHSKFNVNDVAGFSSDSDVNGDIAWNVSSFGLNAVLSRNFKGWIPFVGYGYNYVTGSVSTRLEAVSNTPLVAPIQGGASDHPEQNQGRLLGGLEIDRKWLHLFANGEVKALGQHAGDSWIMQVGAALPFEIGPRGFAKRDKKKKEEQVASAVEYGDYGLPIEKKPSKKKVRPLRPYLPAGAQLESNREFIFIQ